MQFETLQKDMIAAMKDRNKERKDAISSVIQAIKKVAIDEGHRDDISEELVDRVILKELKSVKEQISKFSFKLSCKYSFNLLQYISSSSHIASFSLPIELLPLQIKYLPSQAQQSALFFAYFF